MAQNKERSVYSIENFRGLDKENKLLKVSPFRAANGENFMIDSGTLKTRPAFAYKEDTMFFLNEGEHVIGWEHFRGLTVYVTTSGFRVLKDGQLITHAVASNTQFQSTYNYHGKTPFFREEKDALFIFGFGSIFVLSYFEEQELLIFYHLRDKPTNPFSVNLPELRERYDNLPKPYVPTLFIGDTRFEDVNLISNEFQYKLFSQSQRQTGQENSYFLPTHYNQEKNVSFTETIEFYGGRLDNIEVLPIFMGVEDENFDDGTLGSFGIPMPIGEMGHVSDPVKIVDRYEPSNSFVVSDGDVSRIFGLTPNLFFTLRTNTSETVFDFLISYFVQNQAEISTWEDNRYFAFELPYEVKEVVKDENTGFVLSEKKVRGFQILYVQLKKFENVLLDFETQQQESAMNEVFDTSLPYPEVLNPIPFNTGTGYEENLELFMNDGFPININGFEMSQFDDLSRLFLKNQQSNLVSIDNVKINAKIFSVESGNFSENISQETHKWGAYGGQHLAYMQNPTLPQFYPTVTYTPPSGHFGSPEPLDLGIVQTSAPIYMGPPTFDFIGGVNWSGDNPTIARDLFISKFQNGDFPELDGYISGTVYLKIKFWCYIWLLIDGEEVQHFETAVHVFKVDFSNEHTGTYYRRFTIEKLVTIDVENQLITNNLYSFAFNEGRNAFELKIRDFFFDYNNEPSILVKVAFDTIPDAKKIEDCTFGVSFGSENRLFMAGNPNYPNIDRYNVSNDLLGNNVVNQSYELTFFPSKNFRVLGGKSAINGYIVATDSQLYVTKEKSTTDSSFYIRERRLLENGQVEYFEFKTNINKTPLNHRCLARFYNDIVMLTEEGLFSIEISSNVLTNERLMGMRSGFIKTDLINSIKEVDHRQPFVLEDNEYMYLFIGKEVYVADSRYVAENPSGLMGEVSYEIVKWRLPFSFRVGTIEDGLKLLSEQDDVFYKLSTKSRDDEVSRHVNVFTSTEVLNLEPFKVCFLDNSLDFVLEDPEKYTMWVYEGFLKIASRTNFMDYNYDNLVPNVFTINNEMAVRGLREGSKVFFKDNNGVYQAANIIHYEDDRSWFEVDHIEPGWDVENLYIDIAKQPLYISTIVDVYVGGTVQRGFTLSVFEQDHVQNYFDNGVDTEQDHMDGVLTMLENRDDRFDVEVDISQGLVPLFLNKPQLVEMKWLSGISSFNNDFVEKTLFRGNVYATRQNEENKVFIGYKTSNTIRGFEEGDKPSQKVDLANPFDFEQMNFNIFSLETFSEMGASFPMKQNNFLYIQFVIEAKGQVEINALRFLFKNNRRLKTMN